MLLPRVPEHGFVVVLCFLLFVVSFLDWFSGSKESSFSMLVLSVQHSKTCGTQMSQTEDVRVPKEEVGKRCFRNSYFAGTVCVCVCGIWDLRTWA